MLRQETVEKFKFFHDLDEKEYDFLNHYNSYNDVDDRQEKDYWKQFKDLCIREENENKNLTDEERKWISIVKDMINTGFPLQLHFEEYQHGENDYSRPIEDIQMRLEKLCGFDRKDRNTIRIHYTSTGKENYPESELKQALFNVLDKEFDSFDSLNNQDKLEERAWDMLDKYKYIDKIEQYETRESLDRFYNYVDGAPILKSSEELEKVMDDIFEENSKRKMNFAEKYEEAKEILSKERDEKMEYLKDKYSIELQGYPREYYDNYKLSNFEYDAKKRGDTKAVEDVRNYFKTTKELAKIQDYRFNCYISDVKLEKALDEILPEQSKEQTR